MNEFHNTTIAALATAPAPAGIAVVRVSGPQSKLVIKSLFSSRIDPVGEPRKLVLGEIVDFKSGELIDKAMAVFMPEPNSFTGEDVVEFQFHGSQLLVQKILRSLFSFGIVPAEAGEFTRRAFLNGKLDLAQAEAIGDLINAQSEQALKLASEQLSGRLSTAIEQLGEPLRDVLAEVEASIDFPEEEIEPESYQQLLDKVLKVEAKTARFIESYRYGQSVKEGVRVLLCGRPNAGKSSLLNRLLGRQRAIVSAEPGTTRDLIEERATLSGFSFVFCDSAGIRESTAEVERLGVELAVSRIPWADLVLFIVDAAESDQQWIPVVKFLQKEAKRIWMVTNKIDLNPQAIGGFFCTSDFCQQNFYISVKNDSGIDALINALFDDVAVQKPVSHEAGEMLTNERHRECLLQAHKLIEKVIVSLRERQDLEFIAADIRLCLSQLDQIVGKTYTEDILGRIFSKFCIGK